MPKRYVSLPCLLMRILRPLQNAIETALRRPEQLMKDVNDFIRYHEAYRDGVIANVFWMLWMTLILTIKVG